MNAVRRFRPVKFKKGRVIIREGAAGDTFFVIREGVVGVSKQSHPDFEPEMKVIVVPRLLCVKALDFEPEMKVNRTILNELFTKKKGGGVKKVRFL